jgi:hypothetical protein
VTTDGVWIGNGIYFTLIQLFVKLYKSPSHTEICVFSHVAWYRLPREGVPLLLGSSPCRLATIFWLQLVLLSARITLTVTLRLATYGQ